MQIAGFDTTAKELIAGQFQDRTFNEVKLQQEIEAVVSAEDHIKAQAAVQSVL